MTELKERRQRLRGCKLFAALFLPFLTLACVGTALAQGGPPDAWVISYMHQKTTIGPDTPVEILGKRELNSTEYDVYVKAGPPKGAEWYQVHCVQLMNTEWLCSAIETPFYQFLIPNTVPALPASKVPTNGEARSCILDGRTLFDGNGKFLGMWAPGTTLPPECKSVNAR